MKRIWLIISIVVIAIFITFDLLLAGHGHSVFPWSKVAGFFSLFGLLGCLALIGFSKLIGHYWLQREEDYYDGDNDNK